VKISRSAVRLWAPFTCASLLTFVAYKTLWATQWYWVFLSLLGLLNCGLSALVLRKTGLKYWPILGVAVGLLLGQWWLVQMLILGLFFCVGGFAP
jgi:hypothetical protein